MEDSVLVLIQGVVYKVVSNNDWDKEQIENMVSATAEFSSNYSDFYSSCSEPQMFVDILENIFDLIVTENEPDVFLEVF